MLARLITLIGLKAIFKCDDPFLGGSPAEPASDKSSQTP